MDAPNNAQVDVATKAVIANATADNDSKSMRDEIEARKVEYYVNPYTATFGLNNPNVAKVGGPQSPGVMGEAVVGYCESLTTQDLKSSGFPQCFQGKQHGKSTPIL